MKQRERDARVGGERSARSAHIVEQKRKKLRNLREYMNGTCREHEREHPNCYKHSLGPSAQVMKVGVRIVRAARNYGGADVPRKHDAGELARVHMN
jgi:hypothetical protein